MIIDLVNDALSAASLRPQAITTETTGVAIDFGNGTGATNAILDVGAVSGTTPSMTVQIEESDDGSTNWTAIDGMVFTAVTTANQHQVVRGLRSKQFVRANASDVSGTTPSFQTCVQIIAQKHQVQGAGVTHPGGFDPYPA